MEEEIEKLKNEKLILSKKLNYLESAVEGMVGIICLNCESSDHYIDCNNCAVRKISFNK